MGRLPSVSDIRRDATHQCKLPTMWFKRPGYRWQCDTCREVWQLVDRLDYKYWRRESDLSDYWMKMTRPENRIPAYGSKIHPSEFCGCSDCDELAVRAFEKKLEETRDMLKKQLLS